jgi:hypothetical protein
MVGFHLAKDLCASCGYLMSVHSDLHHNGEGGMLADALTCVLQGCWKENMVLASLKFSLVEVGIQKYRLFLHCTCCSAGVFQRLCKPAQGAGFCWMASVGEQTIKKLM